MTQENQEQMAQELVLLARQDEKLRSLAATLYQRQRDHEEATAAQARAEMTLDRLRERRGWVQSEKNRMRSQLQETLRRAAGVLIEGGDSREAARQVGEDQALLTLVEHALLSIDAERMPGARKDVLTTTLQAKDAEADHLEAYALTRERMLCLRAAPLVALEGSLEIKGGETQALRKHAAALRADAAKLAEELRILDPRAA